MLDTPRHISRFRSGGDYRVGAWRQLNMYAVPQLMPGANEVTVSLENPDVLKQTRFCIEYAWDEGGKPRDARRELDRSPLQFRIDVADGEIPRMRRPTFANLGSRGK